MPLDKTCTKHNVILEKGLAKKIYESPSPEDEEFDSLFPFHGIYKHTQKKEENSYNLIVVSYCKKCRKEGLNFIQTKREVQVILSSLDC